jgi:hypothetical protein
MIQITYINNENVSEKTCDYLFIKTDFREYSFFEDHCKTALYLSNASCGIQNKDQTEETPLFENKNGILFFNNNLAYFIVE